MSKKPMNIVMIVLVAITIMAATLYSVSLDAANRDTNFCTPTLDERVELLENDHVSWAEYRALRRWVKQLQAEVDELKS